MAQRIDRATEIAPRGVGLAWWQYERSCRLKWIEKGDPRLAPDLTPHLSDEDRERLNDGPHSARTVARNELAAMEERGWFEGRWPPPQQIGYDRADPALRQPVRVYRDGRVVPV